MKRLVSLLCTMFLVFGVAATPAAAEIYPEWPRTVAFSGYNWKVKTSSTGTMGPGGNYWSDSTNNVRVASDGMHMTITNTNGRWTCAEVINTTQMGYGTYRWETTGDVTKLAPEVVLGLFTWSDRSKYAYRELDIEYAKWTDPSLTKTGWFTVQTDPNHYKNFALNPATTSVHKLTWTPTAIYFQATAGTQKVAWTWRPSAGHPIPVPGDQKVHMNLWLSQHKPPTTGTKEVVVKSFTYTKS